MTDCTERTHGAQLRECPFCGGEAEMIHAVGEWWAICKFCKATTEAHTDKGFAIAAWNARAERTCRIVTDCHGWWECDECGVTIDWDSCDVNDPPACAYCPNCGAKVVGE